MLVLTFKQEVVDHYLIISIVLASMHANSIHNGKVVIVTRYSHQKIPLAHRIDFCCFYLFTWWQFHYKCTQRH